ncbi:MAG: PIN domain-containing protein [Spirochaetes bacterium]|jgi:tRNA(fMet)-specific endonuclease VapC|nr:PIN domain-containing protein [Spirochaetota bacterium]
MMDLLDTTAFSAAMRNEAEMVRYLGARRPGTVAVAPPVLAEIEYGLRRLDRDSRARTLLKTQKDRLLGHVRILDWDQPSSEYFGEIKAALEKAGTLIDDSDIAIAAIARSHAARVITANLVHFRRIEGVDSHHWTEA